jgi:hypothetical protein
MHARRQIFIDTKNHIAVGPAAIVGGGMLPMPVLPVAAPSWNF